MTPFQVKVPQWPTAKGRKNIQQDSSAIYIHAHAFVRGCRACTCQSGGGVAAVGRVYCQLALLVTRVSGANSARLDVCASCFVECGHRPNGPLHNPVCDVSISQVLRIVDIGNRFLPNILRRFLPRASVLDVELLHRKPMFAGHRDVVCIALRTDAPEPRGVVRSCQRRNSDRQSAGCRKNTTSAVLVCKNSPEKDRPL